MRTATTTGIIESIQVTRRRGEVNRPSSRPHTIFDVEYKLPDGTWAGLRERFYDDELSGDEPWRRGYDSWLRPVSRQPQRVLMYTDITTQPGQPGHTVAWVYLLQSEEPGSPITAWLGRPYDVKMYAIPIIDTITNTIQDSAEKTINLAPLGPGFNRADFPGE